ncbi:MAG: hypothetical protein H6993_02890 [Pseudomonadales bacterium]|nr:hypothetical protein [Pseudomonadales bacterium]MCP5182877.1 hypothetical protein [Pseudomonadales bacterium]
MESTRFNEIRERLLRAEREFAQAIEARLRDNRQRFQYSVDAERIRFEQGVKALHRKGRQGVVAYIRGAPLGYILSAPVTYGLIVPIVLLDIAITLYQRVCFPVYGIERVRRGNYLVFDRRHLAYLNAVEKLNCMYCSYGNGVIAYAREVAARTEQFWCPIKHAVAVRGAHARSRDYLEYGDAQAWHEELERVREQLAASATLQDEP